MTMTACLVCFTSPEHPSYYRVASQIVDNSVVSSRRVSESEEQYARGVTSVATASDRVGSWQTHKLEIIEHAHITSLGSYVLFHATRPSLIRVIFRPSLISLICLLVDNLAFPASPGKVFLNRGKRSRAVNLLHPSRLPAPSRAYGTLMFFKCKIAK